MNKVIIMFVIEYGVSNDKACNLIMFYWAGTGILNLPTQ